ncbi:YbjN domain-containing protein [Cellulomonas sp. PhB143]|uniref:YbjN domain-containing protein n=1 Tax=Cellulomonas sp. PhB143 TaxID=2485186 RepID=UPI000FB599EE|nr:YbjN domain-containing protein [Cellulomonas sp. PhB143]ROS77178.1 putative sensory transduction regulator [Cellulomonas sp. PhB143]
MRFFGARRRLPGVPRETDEEQLPSAVEEVLVREIASALAQSPDDDAGGPALAPPAPLRPDRLVDWAHDCGLPWFVDADGDLGWTWDRRRWAVTSAGADGEILEMVAEWNRIVSIERLEQVLELCNEWNASRIWPTAYAQVDDVGQVHLLAKTAVDLEHGVDDEQLDQLLRCGLHTAASFFDTLDEAFPDPAAGAP